MIARLNEALRPPLDRLTGLVSAPVAIAAQAVVFGAWWASGAAPLVLANAFGFTSLILGLVIIDKQDRAACRDREYRTRVDREVLTAVPGARPEILEE